jgi:hypothetical protein
MKNDKTGLGGRMNDFEFVVIKKGTEEKNKEPKGEKSGGK